MLCFWCNSQHNRVSLKCIKYHVRKLQPVFLSVSRACYSALESAFLITIFHFLANWVGHILRRNCLLQRVIEGKIKGGIEVTGRRGRKRRKLLDDLKERREYLHLKAEALDRTMWRARFGRGLGPVVRQTTK
jgi:hypothetical protein